MIAHLSPLQLAVYLESLARSRMRGASLRGDTASFAKALSVYSNAADRVDAAWRALPYDKRTFKI